MLSLPKLVQSFVFVVCLTISESAPATNNELLGQLERAGRLKSLLRQLDSLPDSDLKDLLLQLRALRRSRGTPQPPRDLSNVPLAQLTDEELLQISNMIPMVEKRNRQPPVRLDIPHDLVRVPVSKFIEAFRIVNGKGITKNMEVSLHSEEAFGDEERAAKLDVVKKSETNIKKHRKVMKNAKINVVRNKEDFAKNKLRLEMIKAAQDLQVDPKDIGLEVEE